VSESMFATGGDGKRSKRDEDGRSSRNMKCCARVSLPHIRREKPEHAPDVKIQIAPAAVALLLQRDTTQPYVLRVVVRETCADRVLADAPARRARVCARDAAERQLQRPA
jgi:hypothetical protein